MPGPRVHAEAGRLEAVAAEKRGSVEHEREEYVARLDEADRLDPGGRRDHEHESSYQGTHVKK